MLAKKAGNRSHRKVEKHDFYFAEQEQTDF